MSTVLISAGDASGDMHAAGFVAALRERRPELRFVGLGGAEMEAAGVELVVHQRAIAVGGFLELAGGLAGVVSAWRRLGAALDREQPALVVLVDSGGFHLPFARRVRRRSRAPILYYVAPQVWAWRSGRVRKLARRVDRLAVIFPFEPEVYAGTGLDVRFVGHPLVERLREGPARLTREAARAALKLPAEGSLVALLPGSRRNEVSRHLPLQLAAARVLHERDPSLRFAVAVAPSIESESVASLLRATALPASLQVAVVVSRTHELMRAADVVLAKPGTATVEAALLERPLVVAGVANALTAAIARRAVHLPSLTMPNLIAGDAIVPEFLQEQATPTALADAVQSLLDGPARELQLAALARVCEKLGRGGAARQVAALAEEMLGSSAS